MKDKDIETIANNIDFFTNHLVTCKNGLMITEGEISVLKRFNINYEKCQSLKEILYQIEEILNSEEYMDNLDELDQVASTIAERDYYQNTNK